MDRTTVAKLYSLMNALASLDEQIASFIRAKDVRISWLDKGYSRDIKMISDNQDHFQAALYRMILDQFQAKRRRIAIEITKLGGTPDRGPTDAK